MAIANASMLDEATAAAEAMALCPADRARARARRFFVADDVLPQTHRRRAHARRAARHRAWSSAPADAAAASAATLRACCCSIPGANGDVRDYRALADAVRARRRARRRRRRPAGAGAARPAGRVGRGRRGRLERSASACRWASAARMRRYLATRDEFKRRMPGRLVGVTRRRRRRAGVPARAADARAAHPPREGDLEHLHRAGAAGGDRGDVRRLSRAGRAARRSRARVHRLTGVLAAGLERARLRRRQRQRSSTR